MTAVTHYFISLHDILHKDLLWQEGGICLSTYVLDNYIHTHIHTYIQTYSTGCDVTPYKSGSLA